MNASAAALGAKAIDGLDAASDAPSEADARAAAAMLAASNAPSDADARAAAAMLAASDAPSDADARAAAAMLAASNAPSDADARAAAAMMAASEMDSASNTRPATKSPGVRTKLGLSVRTSLLCEFRNASGVLQAFDVCHGQTTFGVLCSALSRMPGVEFPDHDPHAWFARPSRFTFQGNLYEVSIPHENIRVCPVNLGEALIEMEELLEYVRHNVLRSRASRYTVR